MKKLLATSALVVAGTSAFADGHISLGGFGEMGILNDGTNTVMHQDLDVNFSLSGETDNGLSFGASMDLDEAGLLGTAGAASQATNGTVFISGDFGTLTMGDTDGAFDWAMTEVGMGTALADNHTSHAGYSGNSGGDSGNVLRYNHSVGDFGFALSYNYASAAAPLAGDVTGIGATYSADLGGTTLGIGVGYQSATGGSSIMGASVSAAISGIDAVVNYSKAEVGGVDTTHMAIGLGYSMDALSVHVNAGQFETAGVKTGGYGANVNYDLGGGAIAALGYKNDGAGDTWSLGVRMNF